VAAKLGLGTFHAALFSELETLMVQKQHVDYHHLLRELSIVYLNDIGPTQNKLLQGLE